MTILIIVIAILGGLNVLYAVKVVVFKIIRCVIRRRTVAMVRGDSDPEAIWDQAIAPSPHASDVQLVAVNAAEPEASL